MTGRQQGYKHTPDLYVLSYFMRKQFFSLHLSLHQQTTRAFLCTSLCDVQFSMHRVQSANGYVLSSIDGLAGSDATLTACQPVNQVHTHALKHTEKAFFFFFKEIEVIQNR